MDGDAAALLGEGDLDAGRVLVGQLVVGERVPAEGDDVHGVLVGLPDQPVAGVRVAHVVEAIVAAADFVVTQGAVVDPPARLRHERPRGLDVAVHDHVGLDAVHVVLTVGVRSHVKEAHTSTVPARALAGTRMDARRSTHTRTSTLGREASVPRGRRAHDEARATVSSTPRSAFAYDEAVAGPPEMTGSATASCVEGRSGEARDAIAPVDGARLEGFDAVVLRRVLQVREQRLGLVGRTDLEVFADRQVVDGGEEDRVAHDAGDGVDDELVRAGAVDDAGAARVDLAVSAAVASAAAAARRGGDGLGGHLVGALGGGVVASAAATGVLSGGLGGSAVAVTMAVSAAVATAAATGVLSGGLLGAGSLGGSRLLGARLLAVAAAAATAAAVLGRDRVGVDQLEHLTISHVFSLSSGPQGHFGKPHTV